MSRIGKLPVSIPSGVTVALSDSITIKGPKGQLSRPIVDGISIEQESGRLVLSRVAEDRFHRARHGLMRALVNNMMIGVTRGFERKLEIIGIGYKAEVTGKKLVLSVGFSHTVEYMIPDGVAAKVEKGTGAVTNVIVLTGIDRELVGQTAANIREFHAPDSYKGKGVRYQGERVRIKPGKTAKK